MQNRSEIRPGDTFTHEGRLYTADTVGIMIKVKGDNLYLPKESSYKVDIKDGQTVKKSEIRL